MAHLTDAENYMKCMRGEVPEWVPGGFVMGMNRFGFDGIAPGPGAPEDFVDLFGVPYVVSAHANNGALPKPDHFILDDIRKWRDVIKRPKILDEYDYAGQAKKVLDNANPDMPAMGGATVGNGYFMMLIAFMGFNNGLVACIEEPEETKELLNFIADLNNELAGKFLDYYGKADIYMMGDDIAHERAPFVSLEVFEDIFEPIWRRDVKPYKEAGMLASHHNCGKFDLFVPHIVDMGFNAWNPAQECNDLVGVKKQFGNKMVISGGLDGNGFVSWPETTEEEIRAHVRKVMDELAPGGGYMFGGYIMGDGVNREEQQKRQGWITDEYEKNKFKYYQ
ncbi:MAG: hypothetical protein FWG30_05400 [Eubacteriaceae bacterium]|nr:hypothetical protein [Eubacteriaceae bacterium]